MRTLFSATDDNATTTLHGLVRGLNARVTRATVRETMRQHPDFPSLLSMSEVLSSWNIDNTALQLNTVEQLRELPLPFIAHLKKQGGWYVLVNSVKGNTIHYTDSERGNVTEPLADFEKAWTGVVLLAECRPAEADEQSGEADYATKRKQERLTDLRGPFVLISTLLLFLFVILSVAKDLNAPDWFLLLTKIIGLGVSSLLVAKQLGSTNALTDRLCRVNANTNCDGVLNSLGAKLWGWLSWADVGLLYFASGLLTVLLVGVQPALRPLLNVLALLALPYTVFSVYYQARVVRQWCPLCLGVQGILVIEGVLALTQLTALPGSIQPYLLLLTVFLLPTLAWVLVKPLLTILPKSRREHTELMALKRDPNLFRAMLTQQPKMPPIPDDLHPLVLGNPDAEHTITMVTNPFCGPCSEVHAELDELLNQNLNVKGHIIFAGGDEKATHVATHMIALRGKKYLQQAMADWYSQQTKAYNVWAKRYPVDTDRIELLTIVKGHSQWCYVQSIGATPMLFLNGFHLSNTYNVSFLKWLVNYLPSTTLNKDLVKSK